MYVRDHVRGQAHARDHPHGAHGDASHYDGGQRAQQRGPFRRAPWRLRSACRRHAMGSW